MSRVFRALLFSVLSTCCFGGSILYLRVHRGVIEERLKTPPDEAAERLRKLYSQFESAGCKGENLSEQEIAKQELPNVICTLPGKEPGTIVIGAPLDFDADSAMETQWATLAVLPLLAESLVPVQHRLSLAFVAFTGHRHGPRGSTEYLKRLTEPQRREILAMVSLEDLGRTPPTYALAQQDSMLANWLTLSANGLRLRSVPMEITARSVDARLINGAPEFDRREFLIDAAVFQRAHIPAIALRSAPQSMVPEMQQAGAWLETSPGTSFDVNIYEQTYNQLCVYLLFLDSNLGRQQFSTPPVRTKLAEAQAKGVGSQPLAQGPGKGPSTDTNKTMVASDGASSPSPRLVQRVTVRTSDLPVFHTQAKLVVMDVSITDERGSPVKGLKAEDFTVFENGKPQKVSVFEIHVPKTSSPMSPADSLSPGTFTNRVSADDDAPLSIFLFDLLNTPPQDQAYARVQMLQFLKTMRRGKYLALFVLGSHLQMVRAFTDDPVALMKTAERVVREVSPLLTTEIQRQGERGFTDEVGRYAQNGQPYGVPGVGGPPASLVSNAAIVAAQANSTAPGFAAQRRATTANIEGIRDDQRITSTLEALKAIARAVSAYPGRKNLVWLSGSFQIRLRPSDDSFLNAGSRTSQAANPVSDLNNTALYDDAIRAATTVMATARIAIYPIDVRGLRTGGVEIGLGADEGRSFVDPGKNDSYNHTLVNESDSRSDERSSMIDLAEQTGGHVFINNDVRGSIKRSLDEGSNYYTLAYAPEKNDNDKSFRRVEIKLNRESAKLAYRPGYYPTTSREQLNQSGAHLLAAAMQPGLPQSTMLLVTAKVLPPDSTSKSLRIDYSIDYSGLDFIDTADNRKRALVDCMAIALDDHGHVAGQVANTMDAALPPSEYLAYQGTGLPLHQELVLPPGTYDVRLGVLDRASQKIGTVNIPVVISAAKPASQ